MTVAVAMGFAAGAGAGIAAIELGALAAGLTVRRAPVLARLARGVAEVVARAGREGRDPEAGERRRLLAAGALAVFSAVTLLAGPLAGAAAACAGPWLTSRLLAARRRAYREAVEAGTPAIALALADALAGGHSLRGALEVAASGVTGAAGHELRRSARALALGARTEDALEGVRARAGSPSMDVLVAAALLQRRAGGDLVGTLRRCARAFEDEARLLQEARAATAQARFSGMLVVAMPLGGAALAELASPGFLAGLATSPLSAWLVGTALALQLAAGAAIRRLGRVRA